MRISNPRLRLVTATVLGSFLSALVGVAFVGLLFGLPLMLDTVHPMDRVNDIGRLPGRLIVGAVGGAILGSLAVFASLSPRRGVSLSWCFAIIAASGGIARFGAESSYRTAEQLVINPHVAALVAAAVATAILLCIGYTRGRN